MCYESALAKVREILDNYKVVQPDFDVDAFMLGLKGAGIDTVESFEHVLWEDLQTLGLPAVKAREVVSVLRSPKSASGDYLTKRQAANLSVPELVARYSYRTKDHVYERLAKMVGGEPCIVINDDGTVAVEESTKLVLEISEHGLKGRKTIMVGDQVHRPFVLGERPTVTLDENPLFPGEPLRPDGTCEHSGFVYASMPHDVRIVLYLAAQNGEIPDKSPLAIKQLFMLLGSDQKFSTVAGLFNKAAIEYRELDKHGGLPNLKVITGTEKKKPYDSGKKSDPFFAESGHCAY